MLAKQAFYHLSHLPAPRISELEDEMIIKGKTEELLVKKLKTCEMNMQELTDSIKIQNLTIQHKVKKITT
jgi:hypothetical protein